MKKTWIALSACAVVASLGLGVARANTIQPIIWSVSGTGPNTYTIDIELTPNNYLKAATAEPLTYPSSVTILDFGHVTNVQVVSNPTGGLAGANVTATSEWAASFENVGASTLANYDGSTAGVFKLNGSNGISGSLPDDSSLSNVTLKYVGTGLSSASYTQRSLIQIEVTTDMTPGPILNSVDTDGNPFTNVQQVDTYSLTTFGVPEPATLSVGLLGVTGLLLRRRRA